MKDLIEKLEKASGPSRELDALIECEHRKLEAYALGLNDKQRSHWKPIGDKGEVIDDQGITRYHPPKYTRSIDAALTLVPRGAEKSLSDIYGEAKAGVGLNFQDGPFYGEHKGGSLAIALCIAALRARDGELG